MKTITNIISYVISHIIIAIICVALTVYLLQDRIDDIAKSNPSVMREDLIEEM